MSFKRFKSHCPQNTRNGTEEEQVLQKYLQVIKDPTKRINGFDLISVYSVYSVYSVDKKGLKVVSTESTEWHGRRTSATEISTDYKGSNQKN